MSDLKKSVKTGTTELIKSSMEELTNEWSKVSQKVYSQQENQSGESENTSSEKSNKANEDEVKDADYEVVDEEK